jgi:hypothetical protein
LFIKYVFPYFQQFLAKMAFWVLKNLRVHYTYKVRNFFSQNRPIWVSKDPYFYANFKKLNLPWCKNAPKKSYWWKTDFLGTWQFFQAKNLFFGNNFFWVHFVTKVRIFWYLYWPILRRKNNFWPYIVNPLLF